MTKLVGALLLTSLLSAADFTVQTVDGLNHPIGGVAVKVSCSGKRKTIDAVTDETGTAHLTAAASCKPSLTSVQKPGYRSYFSGFRDKYVVKRQFDQDEVSRILKLQGDELLPQLRELLASESDLDGAVFLNEAHARPVLRALVREPEVARAAQRLLSRIGFREDLHLLLGLPDPWNDELVTAFIGPDSDTEWSFLESCLFGGDRSAKEGAIQTLKLTADQRSQRLLEEAQQRAKKPDAQLTRALEYIKSNPPPLTGPDLTTLAKRVGPLLDNPAKLAQRDPVFNETRDMALVNLFYVMDTERILYSATFQQTDGVWTLRGVRETSHSFADTFDARDPRAPSGLDLPLFF